MKNDPEASDGERYYNGWRQAGDNAPDPSFMLRRAGKGWPNEPEAAGWYIERLRRWLHREASTPDLPTEAFHLTDDGLLLWVGATSFYTACSIAKIAVPREAEEAIGATRAWAQVRSDSRAEKAMEIAHVARQVADWSTQRGRTMEAAGLLAMAPVGFMEERRKFLHYGRTHHGHSKVVRSIHASVDIAVPVSWSSPPEHEEILRAKSKMYAEFQRALEASVGYAIEWMEGYDPKKASSGISESISPVASAVVGAIAGAAIVNIANKR